MIFHYVVVFYPLLYLFLRVHILGYALCGADTVTATHVPAYLVCPAPCNSSSYAYGFLHVRVPPGYAQKCRKVHVQEPHSTNEGQEFYRNNLTSLPF